MVHDDPVARRAAEGQTCMSLRPPPPPNGRVCSGLFVSAIREHSEAVRPRNADAKIGINRTAAAPVPHNVLSTVCLLTKVVLPMETDGWDRQGRLRAGDSELLEQSSGSFSFSSIS